MAPAMNAPLLRAASALALALAALAASAQNLVANPSFELNGGDGSRSFTGWTVATPDTALFAIVSAADAHSGSALADFQASGATDTLSQSIATVPGGRYTVSFYLREFLAGTSGTKSFASSFGDGSFNLSPTSLPTTYGLFTYTGVASAALTTLSFTGRNDPSSYLLDDVSVTLNPVPEPSALAALGFGAVGLLRRRKRA